MKLDSNRAWKDANRDISRNRDAALALAGVFFLLPQLVLALFFPQPEPTVGMSEQQIVALVQSYYATALPAMIPLAICQALGTLALLILLRHAARPTVGEALRLGVAGLPAYLGGLILLGLGLGVVGVAIITVLALSGVVTIAAAGVLLVLLLFAVVLLRVSLSGAVVAIEGERNPLRALRRSWRLTGGNAWRLLAFYALFFLAAGVVLMIVNLFVGLPLQMLGSATTAEIGNALVSSVITGVAQMYFVAIIAAVHRQLGGDETGVQKPFE